MSAELDQVDKLMKDKKYLDCEKILQKLPNCPEKAWRNARLIYAQIHAMPQEPSKNYLQGAYQQAQLLLDEALDKEPNHANCLTWKGICINQLSQIVGTDERIKNSYKMRELWDKSLSIDPKNNITENCLGVWCFTVADLPEIKRKFAKAFFTKPPESTFEEALEHLHKAEKLDPDVLITTLITLAKCYYNLKNKAKANEYCQKVLEFPDAGYQVADAKEDARKIMKKL